MRKQLEHAVALLLIVLFLMTPVFATCGGGGGGGGGGMSGGGESSSTTVYRVAWKLLKPEDKAPAEGLVLYWFPASKEEVEKSVLRESRPLSLYAAQCVSMQLADGRHKHYETLAGDSKLPVVVLANAADDSVVKKLENKDGKFKIGDVEKLVGDEIKLRETNLDTSLKDAKSKLAAGDSVGAVKLYQSVVAEKCMFPKKARDAEKELKKLDSKADIYVAPAPNFSAATGAQIVQTMKRGLAAENASNYVLADKLYTQASKLDPADPTPLRYLGELYRHHIGDWDKARVAFNKILDMPADPLSRAVALHGLGKMTIHDGEFKKGLGLMEQSVAVYPIALAYRNIAVYWNSEGELTKGTEYTEKALELAPNDPYTLVFAAVFMAAAGKNDEAVKIAQKNVNLLPASYNLAAIYAQAGQRDKALALLKRHFFTYERYQAVRAKEMMEARVDAVFDSLRRDSAFMDLTSGADGKLMMPMKMKMGGMNN